MRTKKRKKKTITWSVDFVIFSSFINSSKKGKEIREEEEKKKDKKKKNQINHQKQGKMENGK